MLSEKQKEKVLSGPRAYIYKLYWAMGYDDIPLFCDPITPRERGGRPYYKCKYWGGKRKLVLATAQKLGIDVFFNKSGCLCIPRNITY